MLLLNTNRMLCMARPTTSLDLTLNDIEKWQGCSNLQGYNRKSLVGSHVWRDQLKSLDLTCSQLERSSLKSPMFQNFYVSERSGIYLWYFKIDWLERSTSVASFSKNPLVILNMRKTMVTKVISEHKSNSTPETRPRPRLSAGWNTARYTYIFTSLIAPYFAQFSHLSR